MADKALAIQMRNLLASDGIVQKEIEASAARTKITLEELITKRRAAGVDWEVIRQELLDDLDRGIKGENMRVFGTFQTDMKNIVYGASNEAATLGMKVALEQAGGPNVLYRWQTNGSNVCEDCEARNGEVYSLKAWETFGLPKQFGSRCAENCQCWLVPQDVEFKGIDIGQEAA